MADKITLASLMGNSAGILTDKEKEQVLKEIIHDIESGSLGNVTDATLNIRAIGNLIPHIGRAFPN